MAGCQVYLSEDLGGLLGIEWTGVRDGSRRYARWVRDGDLRGLVQGAASASPHSRTVPSQLLEASRAPSGLKARLVTRSVWPVRVARSAPLSASHRRRARSWWP